MKKILENFQLDDIIDNEDEFQKLWSKFDLNNTGVVRANIFLRLLDYRVNLADEIDANIQRLVSRSNAAGMIGRRISSSTSSSIAASGGDTSPSRKQRQLSVRRSGDSYREKHSAPPPTALGRPLDETIRDSDGTYVNDDDENNKKNSSTMNQSTRELSTKFRTLVQQHRRMIKQLNEGDEFVPFLDRKVNRMKDLFRTTSGGRTLTISLSHFV